MQLAVKVKAPLKTARPVQGHRQIVPRRDLPGKVFGTLDNGQRRAAARHAACAHDPPDASPARCRSRSTKARSRRFPAPRWSGSRTSSRSSPRRNGTRSRPPQALKVTWSESKPNFPGHDEAACAHPQCAGGQARRSRRENGSVEDGFKQAARIIEGEYEYPTQSHASMGPACAVADVRDGDAPSRPARRSPMIRAACVAELLGLPREKVRAIWMFGTGSYGRNDQGDATADAAVLSQASRPAGAGAVHAPRGPRLGSQGHRLGQPQPRRARCRRQGDRLREHQQGVLAPRHHRPARAAPPTCWPGICSACR